MGKREEPGLLKEAPFRLCLVTDRRRGDPGRLVERCRQAVEAGADAIQLRERDMSGRELYETALAIQRALGAKAALLVNDRVDVAMAIPGVGAHLPANGIPPAEARRLLGPGRLIGKSAHSPGEAAAAAREGADYVFFGPVYETPSHQDQAPQGLKRLQETASAAGIPVYAIGGIIPPRPAEVRRAGAAGIAVLSYWQEGAEPAEAVRRLLESWEGRGPAI